MRAIHFRAAFFAMLWLCACINHEAFGVDQVYGARPGYVVEVQAERHQRVVEMILISKPASNSKSLNEMLFDERLTKEFQSQYENRFGRTDIERNVVAPQRAVDFQYFESNKLGQSLTAIEYQRKQQRFGNFMMRRLTEHHVDHYVKTNPTIRPVYEIKERISNVKVEVRDGYRLRFRYFYSGNALETKLENPYKLDTKLTLQMNSSTIGPSDIQETTMQLGYNLTPTVSMTSYYKIKDSAWQFVTAKQLNENWSTSLTGIADHSNRGTSLRQNMILIGLGWSG